MLLAKPRSAQETVSDLDGHLMCFWRVLRDDPAAFERVCALTPHSRAERELSHTITSDLPDLEIARRVYVALTQGRTGSLTRTGWRQHHAATSTPMPVSLARFAGRIAPAAARLYGVSLESRPALEMIEAYGGDRRALLYLDPPYIVDPGTRRGGEYRIEMRDRAEHRKMLELCVEVDASVVISGYDNAVYTDVLTDWYRYAIPTYTTQRGVKSPREEIVWSNRPLTGLGDTENEGNVSVRNAAVRTETPARCSGCSAVLRQPKTGRRRRWCSDACKQKARRLLT